MNAAGRTLVPASIRTEVEAAITRRISFHNDANSREHAAKTTNLLALSLVFKQDLTPIEVMEV
jgi:hypothetical protein